VADLSAHNLIGNSGASMVLLRAIAIVIRLASVSLSACSPPPRPAAFSVNVPLRSTSRAPGDSATASPPPSCCAWLPCSGVQSRLCKQVAERAALSRRWLFDAASRAQLAASHLTTALPVSGLGCVPMHAPAAGEVY
jgi:hypothetical protein